MAQVAPGASPNAYEGETVMTRDGFLAAPWKEVRACKNKEMTEGCVTAVVHAKTREIARAGAKWSSKFEPTGSGKEVRRAETAMDKAIRQMTGK